MRNGGRGAQLIKRPIPLFYIKWLFNTFVLCTDMKSASFIETGTDIYEMIHIRVIRCARRPSLLTPNSSLLTSFYNNVIKKFHNKTLTYSQ